MPDRDFRPPSEEDRRAALEAFRRPDRSNQSPEKLQQRKEKLQQRSKSKTIAIGRVLLVNGAMAVAIGRGFGAPIIMVGGITAIVISLVLLYLPHSKNFEGMIAAAQTPEELRRRRKRKRRVVGWGLVILGASAILTGWLPFQRASERATEFASLLNDQGRRTTAVIVDPACVDCGDVFEVVYTADDGSTHRAQLTAGTFDYVSKEVTIWYIPDDWRVGRKGTDGTFSVEPTAPPIFITFLGIITSAIGLVLLYRHRSKSTGIRTPPS